MVCALLRIYARTYKIKCFFIQLQNPRISVDYFDVIIPPYHDKLTGHNIIGTTGSLNHITQKKISDAVVPIFIQGLSVPVITVFIGGRNKKYKFTDGDAQQFAYHLKEFMVYNKCALWITASRRTSEKQYQMIQNILSGENVFFWNGTGDNPYFAMLKISKMAIVTSDSVNMLCEIATAGVKILLYPLTGKAGKFNHLYQDLKKRKLLQEFSLTPKKIAPSVLNETTRIVKKLLPKINKFFTDKKNSSFYL
jgi:mitochondrial fission protein ELM1